MTKVGKIHGFYKNLMYVSGGVDLVFNLERQRRRRILKERKLPALSNKPTVTRQQMRSTR